MTEVWQESFENMLKTFLSHLWTEYAIAVQWGEHIQADPEDRVTAEEAMNHPYFDDIRKEEKNRISGKNLNKKLNGSNEIEIQGSGGRMKVMKVEVGHVED